MAIIIVSKTTTTSDDERDDVSPSRNSNHSGNSTKSCPFLWGCNKCRLAEYKTVSANIVSLKKKKK